MPAVNEAVLLDALKAVIDPNTGKDLVSTKALKNLRIEGGDVAFDVELGYPAKSQMPALRKALIAAARTVRRRAERQRQPELEDRRACGAARRAVAAQGEEHRRRGLGQGRRGQEHHGRQPGAGAGGRRRQRRHPRCRHLRPQPADDDGHRRPPRKQRRQDHGADAELRRAGHVDRLPDRRRQPDDLARPDGHAGARTAAAPDQLERPGLPASSTCRPAPATSSSRCARRCR